MNSEAIKEKLEEIVHIFNEILRIEKASYLSPRLQAEVIREGWREIKRIVSHIDGELKEYFDE